MVGFYVKYAAKPFSGLISFWAILFLFVIVSNGVIWPYFQKTIVSLFENTSVAGGDFIMYALPTVIMITAVWIMIDLSELGQSVLGNRWRPKVQDQINKVLHDYTHNQSMGFWTNRIVGKVNSQINYVSSGFVVLQDLMMMLAMLIVVALNMYLILEINKYVAFLLAFAFAFRVIYGIMRIKPMNKASKTAAESSSALSGKVIDSLSNYSIVKLFSGMKRERKHLEPARQKNIDDRIFSGFMQRWFWGLPMFVWDILFGAMLMLCVYLYSKGQMKISEIVFTMSVYNTVMGSISNIIRQIPNLVDVIGSAQKSYEELVKPIDISDIPNAPCIDVSKGYIEFKNVYFKYKKKNVLDNFSLKIAPGEKVGLVGASGAGKTTLVNLLMRFYDPGKGGIYIDGQNIKEVTQDSLRENIAFIPQEPTMFNRSLRDNIGYGKPGATDKEIRRAAREAQADKFITESPKKYDSMVGDRGIKLSGGQRQRIAIARAFLKDAPILILDEATSALDSETEAAIQKSFEELSRGRTTLAIAHRLSTLRNMDRIVVMEKGRIAEQGTHAQLFRKKNGIYARLWNMQSGGFINE